MSVFDVYTVTTIPSPYRLRTEMSAPSPHHHGARPKTITPTPTIRYACVAYFFEDFKTAHSLRCHMIQVHNIACDTLFQGRPFPHVGHVMKRPNEREKCQFPRTVFPDDWAVSHRPDVNPACVRSTTTPPPIRGRWPNISCIPIFNADGTDNFFGLNRSNDITKAPLCFEEPDISMSW